MDHRTILELFSRHFCLMACVVVVCYEPMLEARFQPEDANEIDQEERLNSESYNDEKSYAFPLEWQRDWSRRSLGFRVSAGSLNIDKFYYREQLKLLATQDGGGIFSFAQDRNEDFLFQSNQAEVRLGWQIRDSYFAGVAGEGGYFKKYGDLGFFAGIGAPKGNHAELALYSVDHYYNEKEPGPNRYATKPWTVRGSVHYLDEPTGTLVEAQLNYDSPLVWEQEDQSSTYAYRQATASVLAVLPIDDMTSLVFDADYGRKFESRSHLIAQGDKSLDRWASRIDMSACFVTNKERTNQWQPGLAVIHRHANYDYSRPDLPDLERDDRLHSPDSMRRELLPYVLAQTAIGSSSQTHAIYGPIWSATEIAEDNRPAFTNEVKFQAALEQRWTPEVRVLLNTNWDVDNLTTDYPYRERSFRPWDGGNLQIQAVF